MPKKKTTLPKNFGELCQTGDLAVLQAVYDDTDINAVERTIGKSPPAGDARHPARLHAMADRPRCGCQFPTHRRRQPAALPPSYIRQRRTRRRAAAKRRRRQLRQRVRQHHPPFRRTAPLVKLLLVHGANPAAKNRRGQTPFDSLLDSAPLSDRTALDISAAQQNVQEQNVNQQNSIHKPTTV